MSEEIQHISKRLSSNIESLNRLEEKEVPDFKIESVPESREPMSGDKPRQYTGSMIRLTPPGVYVEYKISKKMISALKTAFQDDLNLRIDELKKQIKKDKADLKKRL